MRTRSACLSAFFLLLAIPQAARAGGDTVTVTATVQPKRIVLSDLKLNKPAEITITYLLTNHTAQTQVVNRFCTLRPVITGDDGHAITLNGMGSDGSRLIGAPDILILAPGKQEAVLFHIGVEKTAKGIIIVRNDESGFWWGGSWINTPKFLDMGNIYADQLTNAQIENLRPELKAVKYALPDLKMPAVRLEIAP